MWEERWECGRRGGSVGGEVGGWEERWECGRRGGSAGGEVGVREERWEVRWEERYFSAKSLMT